jgi:hypothetical protein
MPNPPYTAVVIVLEDGPDGISADVVAWDDKIATDPSTLDGPRHANLVQALKQTTPKPTFYAHRSATTRAALKTLFGALVDQRFPDIA